MECLLHYMLEHGGAYYPHPTRRIGELIPAYTSAEDVIHVKRIDEYKRSNIVILYIYGNGDDVLHMVERTAKDPNHSPFLIDLAKMSGATCVTFDMPGYGASTGKCTEHSIRMAALAVMDWIRIQYKHPRIIIWGKSLGSVAASYLASKSEVNAVVLQSPLCSAVRWRCNTQYKILCGTDALNTLDCARENAHMWGRILIIHGAQDTITKVWHSRLLYEACAEQNPQTRLVVIEHRDHNDIEFFERYTPFKTHILDPILHEQVHGHVEMQRGDD